jgi:WD40 repeat protein
MNGGWTLIKVWSAVSGRICRWYDGHTGVIHALRWLHPYPLSADVDHDEVDHHADVDADVEVGADLDADVDAAADVDEGAGVGTAVGASVDDGVGVIMETGADVDVDADVDAAVDADVDADADEDPPPSGDLLLTASQDGTLRLWDVTGEPTGSNNKGLVL